MSERYVRDAIEALLADQDPPVSETPPVGCSVKWKESEPGLVQAHSSPLRA